MDVKLANTTDHRQASDQLTQIRAAGIIKLDIIKLKILYIDVESVQQFSYSALVQVPGTACVFKCWGQVWSWLKNYPNYIWTRGFWPKAEENGCIDLCIGHLDCVGIGQNKTVVVHESICLWILYWYSVDYYSQSFISQREVVRRNIQAV